jgi:hypothetical protein
MAGAGRREGERGRREPHRGAFRRRIRRQGPRIIRSLLAHESVLTQNEGQGPWIRRPSLFQETRRDTQEHVA